MRITESKNINETIRVKNTDDKVVYGDWWLDAGNNVKGYNVPHFVCTMTNEVTNTRTTFKCPFSTKKYFIENSMMRVIECYNDLVELLQMEKMNNINRKFTLFVRNTSQIIQEHKLRDALYDYIKYKYSDKYYFDYKFNFNKKYKRSETYIYVDCPGMLNNLKKIEITEKPEHL